MRQVAIHSFCRRVASCGSRNPAFTLCSAGASRFLWPFYTSRIPSNAFMTRVDYTETIYALSTAPGRAAIAVVRISGPRCLQIYGRICPHKPPPKPRKATICKIYDPDDSGNVVDSAALVLYFPATKTVTGEDVLELHIHGGPATQKAVLSAIAKVGRLTKLPIRYAEPGEFTRRAFQNNKLDLGQVEALSNALAAETELQRRAAVRGHSGKLGQTYENWREKLLYARGELEALIDFSEDQHFDETPQELLKNVTLHINSILREIKKHDTASHCGELIKRGIRFSLLGPPNVGKSSLLNQIVGREASIVSQEAGTTRDIVEVSLDIRGYLCTFADTAGLRFDKIGKSSKSIIGAVEKEGIRRAKSKASESDIIIVMASIEPLSAGGWHIKYDEESLAIAEKASDFILVLNKCDQSIPHDMLLNLNIHFSKTVASAFPPSANLELIPISCQPVTKDAEIEDSGNIKRFISELVARIEKLTSLPVDMEDLIGVTERQRLLLESCSSHLQEFKTEAERREADVVLAAEHLRSAANCLARITGRGEASDVEEVLGVVFEKFCVGK